MAKLLGTVNDFEDYKQKIVKQRKLHKKTINAVKAYLSIEETKFLETKMIEESAENLKNVQTTFRSRLNSVYKSFKNNSEKYEYLIKNNPNDKWIEDFKQTKEYKLLYE